MENLSNHFSSVGSRMGNNAEKSYFVHNVTKLAK